MSRKRKVDKFENLVEATVLTQSGEARATALLAMAEMEKAKAFNRIADGVLVLTEIIKSQIEKENK